jgi:hypothetical protein
MRAVSLGVEVGDGGGRDVFLTMKRVKAGCSYVAK